MSNKTLTAAVQTALDLCRDAYGNGMSGQEERSLRYIALAVEQLRTTIQYLENKGDVRNSIALENLTRSLRQDTHPAYAAFPEIDGSLVGPAMTRWSSRKLPDGVLRAMNIDALPPEMQAAVAEQKKDGAFFHVNLTAEEASEVFPEKPTTH